MFGPDITTKAHVAFASARVHSNNTAEMSALVDVFSFLGPHGPVARDAHSCVFYDSEHAAGFCVGTIHARTRTAWTLLPTVIAKKSSTSYIFSCSTSTVTRKILETNVRIMPLGAFGLVSNHNLSTRWVRHSFDSASRFATCHNLGDVLEKLRDIGTEHVSASRHQNQELALCGLC